MCIKLENIVFDFGEDLYRIKLANKVGLRYVDCYVCVSEGICSLSAFLFLDV